jgi:GNAT superfamily N-acetyltransferase
MEERPDAALRLAEWFVDEWPEYHRGRELPDVASRFRLVPDVQETLIAEIGDELVGSVALRGPWEAAPEIPPPWIGGLYVAADHRGQGIAQELINAAVALAADEGFDTVHMAIRVDPDGYVERGWRVVGTVFAGDDRVTVVKRATA